MPDRFFVSTSLDRPTVELTGTEAHHLMHVLRMKTGQQVGLFDGRGGEATAEIVSLAKRSVELRIIEICSVVEETAMPIVLGTAVPKGDRFRWMVEKATELGVDRLVPLETARGIVDPKAGKLEKMRQTVIAACKQSGRSRLMEVGRTVSWDQFVAQEFPQRTALVAHPDGEAAGDALRAINFDAPVLAAVGPEGGFTDREVETAVAAGARLLSLGPRILRVETAAIALAAILTTWTNSHSERE